jgi:hypothetical protein
MANETIMQGLLDSLMKRPEDATQQRGALLANIMNTPNPLAATVASMLPGQMANVNQAARGLFGLQAPVSPAQKLQEMITANPALMNSSAGLKQLLQQASATGNTEAVATLAPLVAQAVQAEQSAQMTRETTSGQRMATLQQVEAAIVSAPSEAAKRALTGLRTAVMAGNYDGKDITAPLDNILKMTAVKSTAGMDQKDVASLYKDFTPESVQNYLINPSAVLVPRTAGAKEPPTSVQEYEYAKTQGYSGSYQDWVGLKQASVVSQNLSPVQQVTLLNEQLFKLPTVDKTADSISQLKQVKDVIPLLNSSNPQAFTLVSAVLPQLIGSNSRAQAEIDAFRDRKGISESLGDYLTRIAGGTATKETQENIKEIINILDANFTAQRLREVNSVAAGFKGVVPPDVLDRWTANQLYDISDDVDAITNKALGL